MSEPTTGLEQQIAAMEQTLLANPDLPAEVRAYLHLQAAFRLLQGSASGQSKNSSRSPLASNRGTGKVRRAVDPSRLKVLEHAANVIRGKPHPLKTADIYDALDAETRALIRGTEPKSNLSAMLFHSPAFVSHGRAGWTLSEHAAPPTAAEASPVPAPPADDKAWEALFET